MDECARTSPRSAAARASSTARFTASHAQSVLPRVHASNSPFFLGAYTVGQNVFLCLSETCVNAAELGTSTVYGSESPGMSGSAGTSGHSAVSARRTVSLDSCFRIRLRWDIVGVSSPLFFSHLHGGVNALCLHMTCGNVLEHRGCMSGVGKVDDPSRLYTYMLSKLTEVL